MADEYSKGLSRRRFLELCGAGTCGGIAHQLLGRLAPMQAFAAPLSLPATGAIKNLCVFHFSGGLSYNVANMLNGTYRDLCPNTSYDEGTGAHALDGKQVLHPSLAAFKAVFDAGDLAVMNLVGYHDPNYSHQESTNIMHLGKRLGSISEGGWGAKLSCQIASLFPGVALGGNPLLMQGGCLPGQPGVPPTALGNIENFGVGKIDGSDNKTEWVNIALNSLLASGGVNSSAYAFAAGEINKFEQIIAVVKEQTEGISLPRFDGLNSNFTNQCKDAAKLILAPALGVRIISMDRGGFDTHNGETTSLTNNLADVNAGIGALVSTLIDYGKWSETAVLTTCDFGRTFENNSDGTDHGNGTVAFLMGGRVNGRVVNEGPNDAKCAAAANSTYRFDEDDMEIHWWQIYREVIAAMGLPADVIEPPTIVYSGLNLIT